MERQRPSATLYRLIFGIETTVLTIAAFVSTYVSDDVLGALFHYAPTIWIIGALITWAAVAWTARRILVGQIKGANLTGRPVIGWVILRVALLSSCCILVAGWLTAFVIGSALSTAFIQAAALLTVVSFVIGVAGGAAINSLLAARRVG